MHDREFYEILQHILNGTVEYWHDSMFSQTHITLNGNQRMDLNDEILRTKTKWEIIQLIIDHFYKKELAAATSVLGDGATDKERRIHEINEELDIIRGVKPTPPGYTIDISRVKDLMAELKKLL